MFVLRVSVGAVNTGFLCAVRVLRFYRFTRDAEFFPRADAYRTDRWRVLGAVPAVTRRLRRS